MFLQVEDAVRTFFSTVRNVFHIIHVRYLSLFWAFTLMFAKYWVFTPLLSTYLDDTHFKYSPSPVGEPNNSSRGQCMVIQVLSANSWLSVLQSTDMYTMRNWGSEVKQVRIKVVTYPPKAVMCGCSKNFLSVTFQTDVIVSIIKVLHNSRLRILL
jgi:hypothetical protein